jgi:hypothetical protein
MQPNAIEGGGETRGHIGWGYDECLAWQSHGGALLRPLLVCRACY